MINKKLFAIIIVSFLFLVIPLAYAPWFDLFESDCSNSIDDDFDGDTDCADSDCSGQIKGYVNDESLQEIEGARIRVLDASLNPVQVHYSNQSGLYASSILCGTYTVVTDFQDKIPLTEENVVVSPLGTMINNATLYAGNVCQDDCTLTGNNIIEAACQGINGCSFYDSTSAAVCDNAQPGWIKDYNATHFLQCAEGIPQNKTQVASAVSCSEENLIKVTKVVSYQGKLVKLVVVTCG